MTHAPASHQNRLTIPQLFKSITLQEWLTAAVIAAAIGVGYWAWTQVYELTKPILKPLGLKYLSSGLWVLACVFLSDLIRKPGIAVFASVLAALVEGIITQWGMQAFVYGFIQGLGAELIFALFLYRNWSIFVLSLAAAASALLSYSYDYLMYEYAKLPLGLNLLQLASFMVSAVVLAAFLGRYLSLRLLKTGLIDVFLIAEMQKTKTDAPQS
jgi:energy-coupling factor transport system substrate-specific component